MIQLFMLLVIGYSHLSASDYETAIQAAMAYRCYDDECMDAIITPYLIPENHPIKPTLDALFTSTPVLDNEKTLKKAGFQILYDKPNTYVIIARHSKFPGYIFKLYLDNEYRLKDGKAGWWWLAKRCEGARLIKNTIAKFKIRHFIVTDKWLYRLPPKRTTRGIFPQPVVLVETDMNLVSPKENKKAWKTKVTPAVLEELYILLSHGYGSIYLTGNIPYSKSGQFAFIDTEYPVRHFSLKKAGNYLSKKMNKVWNAIIQKREK